MKKVFICLIFLFVLFTSCNKKAKVETQEKVKDETIVFYNEPNFDYDTTSFVKLYQKEYALIYNLFYLGYPGPQDAALSWDASVIKVSPKEIEDKFNIKLFSLVLSQELDVYNKELDKMVDGYHFSYSTLLLYDNHVYNIYNSFGFTSSIGDGIGMYNYCISGSKNSFKLYALSHNPGLRGFGISQFNSEDKMHGEVFLDDKREYSFDDGLKCEMYFPIFEYDVDLNIYLGKNPTDLYLNYETKTPFQTKVCKEVDKENKLDFDFSEMPLEKFNTYDEYRDIKSSEVDFSDYKKYSGEDVLSYNDFKYRVVEGKIEILDYIGEESEIIIPSEINSNIVNSIGDCAFEYCQAESIILPNHLEKIGNCAFFNCKKKAEIVFPNTLKSIGNYAFAYASLTKIIELPESLETIGVGAFLSSKNISTISMHDNVTYIGNMAFANASLREIILSKGISEISDFCFTNSRNLIDITIKEGVKRIGIYSFYNVGVNYNSLSFGTISVKLPESLETIEKYAFSNVRMESISILKNVKNIDSLAFFDSEIKAYKVSSDNEYYISKNKDLLEKSSEIVVAKHYEK